MPHLWSFLHPRRLGMAGQIIAGRLRSYTALTLPSHGGEKYLIELKAQVTQLDAAMSLFRRWMLLR